MAGPAAPQTPQGEVTKVALQGVLTHLNSLLTPAALALAETRKSPREKSFADLLATGGPAGTLTPAPIEKQTWVNQVSIELQSKLGLSLPLVMAVFDEAMPALEARCSAVPQAAGENQYVLSFGASEYSFSKATIAHEFGHAQLDGVIANSATISGVYWRLDAQIHRLHQASAADPTFELRRAAQEVAKRLEGTGSNIYRFVSPDDNFVRDSYHELYADFVACFFENNPDAMFEAEQVAQRDGGHVEPQWELRRFFTPGGHACPSNLDAAHYFGRGQGAAVASGTASPRLRRCRPDHSQAAGEQHRGLARRSRSRVE